MKNLFAKFKLSSSLDSGQPLSAFWRRKVSQSADLKGFEEAAREMDHALKRPADPAPGGAPVGLHASIMRAVRASNEAGRAKDQSSVGAPWALRWGMAFGLLLVLGVGAWMVVDHLRKERAPTGRGLELVGTSEPSVLPIVGVVIEQLATNGVALLRSPMNRQIEDLSSGLRETAQFLLASLP